MTVERGPIQPKSLVSQWSTRFAYSYGYKAGNMVWIAGQVARNGDGELVGLADPEAQAVQCYENIKAVVETAGGTLDDIVSCTTYLSDRAYREPVTEVRHRYFKGPDYPTNTLCIVTGLGLPEYLVEIEAVAVLQN